MVKKLFGTYERSLDNKGRLLIPAKLLLGETESLYAIQGHEGCIAIYDEEAFNRLTDKLMNMDFDQDAEQRAYVRLAASSVTEMKIDSHGRILLGRQMLSEYRIGQSVTVIGVLDHFEIWDATAYAKYLVQNGRLYDTRSGIGKGNAS